MTYLAKANAVPLPLIKRILDEPEAVALVQTLDPQVLKKLIAHIGLQEAGGIIELATAPQIGQIFDAVLWRNQKPGQEEVLDLAQLKLWLEVMVDTNVEEAAAKWVALDEKFVLLVLNSLLLVLSQADLMALLAGSDTADLVEKALASHHTLEFNTYLLVSRDEQGWDAIISLLVEVDKNNHEWLERQLERCRRLSTSYIEDNDGLYNVLTDSEKLASDVAEEREDRRESQGHVAAQTAGQFLFLISQTSLEELIGATRPDPITRAYFSAFSQQTGPHAPMAEELPPSAEPVLRLTRILTEAKILAEEPAAAAAVSPAGSSALLRRALTLLAETDPPLHQQRIMELGYLANILMAGHAHENRRYLPSEAAQAAVDICNQGLALIAERVNRLDTDEATLKLIRGQDMVKMFRVGWKMRGAQANGAAKG